MLAGTRGEPIELSVYGSAGGTGGEGCLVERADLENIG
jgi:hypothetical protein